MELQINYVQNDSAFKTYNKKSGKDFTESSNKVELQINYVLVKNKRAS